MRYRAVFIFFLVISGFLVQDTIHALTLNGKYSYRTSSIVHLLVFLYSRSGSVTLCLEFLDNDTFIYFPKMDIKFSDPRIIATLRAMKSCNNLESLQFLQHQILSLDTVDSVLQKEYALLLYVLSDYYATLYNHSHDNIKKEITLNTLEEILIALEILMEELPILIAAYEKPKETTWKKWIKKHWFALTVGGLVITIKVVIEVLRVRVKNGEKNDREKNNYNNQFYYKPL